MKQRYPMLAKFLAVDRWRALLDRLKAESSTERQPLLDSIAVVLALVICSFPVIFTALETSSGASGVNSTIAFGICTLLALLLRSMLKLKHVTVASWRESLSLTHTAVALGCIPALLIILLNPSLLSSRHDALTQAASAPTEGPGLAYTLTMILGSALWISVTEEFLFRGLLVSVIRRWRVLSSQRTRDFAAVLISAALFGLAHYPTWGGGASIALGGLGIGFVLGFIANGERLLPLIIYHFIFDALSILVAVLS
jgi:membrane protease YdiL (CAAX protease family)